jgi:nitronate monooxygenase
MVTVSFGDEWSWVQRAHDAGVSTATQVGDVEAAHRAVDAGVDVVIARGAEGGGHGEPTVGTLPLLSAVLDHVSVPVLAAGGISSGRGLAAVLAAGASGAWLGTAFCACTEALTPAVTRRALLAADETSTVTTRVFDIAQGYGWPAHLPERALRNAFVDRWAGHENELVHDDNARKQLADAVTARDHSLAPVNAGQGVRALTDEEPAALVIGRFVDEAVELLGRWADDSVD